MINLMQGDCLEKMKDISDNSIDSVVTDPPYGLSFMGKKWDYDVPSVEIWKEVLRVLKPGGHVLSFGGTRTYHRMVVNIEDAGFEIRDQIQWLYGSGFPKSTDVSKRIDKEAGEITTSYYISNNKNEIFGKGKGNKIAGISREPGVNLSSLPVTEKAKEWQGWGSALKPANEPIVLARKPLEKGLTLAENVLNHKTGAINIDASRVKYQSDADKASAIPQGRITTKSAKDDLGKTASSAVNATNTIELNREEYAAQLKGRWPANVILDEVTGCASWSRFFYVAKASKSERNAGLDGMPLVESEIKNDSGSGFSESDPHKKILMQNYHPTVKPIKLMQYLIKLITPPSGIVLDPFMGSGSTGFAAKNLNFSFVGIEMNENYFEIASKRING